LKWAAHAMPKGDWGWKRIAFFWVGFVWLACHWRLRDTFFVWGVAKWAGPAEGVGVRGRSPWVGYHCQYWYAY
jgi:hypothetical protein